MATSASAADTPRLRAIRALRFPGVDLPLPDGSAPVTPVQPVQPMDATDLHPGGQADSEVVLGHLDSQHRIRCRKFLHDLRWGPDTVLVAHVDRRLPTAWLQAQSPPCPHADCRHDHSPPVLPGTTEPHTDTAARSRAQVAGQGDRLRVPPGLCHWVGTRAGQDLFLIARPELDAVELTSPAVVTRLLAARRQLPHPAHDNVTSIAARSNLA